MKIALIYNPDAGMGQLEIDDLKSLFTAAGYELLSVSTKNRQWHRLLSEPLSRVVIAGGDGTVRKIVPLLAERNIPFSILPLGTANNIATSLHQMHSVRHLIAGLSSARPKWLDLGLVRSESIREPFIEAVGVGLLAELMRQASAEKSTGRLASEETPDKKVAAALETLATLADHYPGTDCEFLIDNSSISGSFLLAEIMNISCIGPNLPLAPDADPSDGWLELAYVPLEQRDTFRRYLSRLRQGELDRVSIQHPTLPIP